VGRSRESGQGSVEWVGLIALVAALFVALLAVAPAVPGVGLARALASSIACALRLPDECDPGDDLLAAAYGEDVAKLVRDNAPELVFEADSSALPVDFRSCRGPVCGNGERSGTVRRSNTGEPAAAFVHVVDCRAEAIAASERSGYDCSGGCAGNVYVQFWLYYEDSVSLRDVPGGVGTHQDDWESFQVRIRPDGVDNRASSHNGYNYDGGIRNWLSDAGIVHRSAWGPATGREYVSGGSHAGHVHEDDPNAPPRWTPSGALELIPIEALDRAARHTRFAITPPWRKPVYRDPEDEGT
jgi:hypothetical protein